MTGYLRPVTHEGGVSTFIAHTRRTRPSQEPGVDFYCPIGTPVYAIWSGVVVAVGGGIVPATGRYVTVNLDPDRFGMKRRVRYLHLSKQSVRTGQRVERGDVIGLSGASGYGSEYFGASSLERIPSNTGGPHVHVTLWPGHWQRFGSKSSGAIDIEQHISGPQLAGEGDEEFMEKIDELWQNWMPGKKGVKVAGEGYKLFVEIVQKVRTAAADSAKGVWATTVSRGGKKITALQELADAKSAALANGAKLEELLKRPATTVSLTDAQVDQLAAKVGDKVALTLAPAVLDALADRLKD